MGEANCREGDEPRIGSQLELDTGPIAHGGHCVARHDGRVVFVRHTIPGELVRARVTRVNAKGRYLFADAVEILRASPARVSPPCRYAGPGGCGGCDFQHVTLAEQRRLKSAVVEEQLRRLGGIDVDALPGGVRVEPVHGDQKGLRWRTRLTLAVDAHGRTGLRPFHSHEVLPVRDCLIATEAVVASGALRRRYPKARAVEVVADDSGRAIIIPLPARRPVAPIRQHVRVGAWSAEFELDPRSFWQVHPGAAATLTSAVLQGLAPRVGERVLDLYAGVGLFGRALADAVGADGAVLLVESDRRAAEAAAAWAEHVPQAEVRLDRVDRALAPLVVGGDRVDLVVLDPPRSGSGAEVITTVTRMSPRAIAYVACDPAALARDVAIAVTAGYRLRSVRAFDQFPMTHHVECVAILEPILRQP